MLCPSLWKLSRLAQWDPVGSVEMSSVEVKVDAMIRLRLRASVLFQVSKLAQLGMQQAKVSAGLAAEATLRSFAGRAVLWVCAWSEAALVDCDLSWL